METQITGESAESVEAKGFGETAEPGGSEGSVGSDVFERSAPSLTILDASLNSVDQAIYDGNNAFPFGDSCCDAEPAGTINEATAERKGKAPSKTKEIPAEIAVTYANKQHTQKRLELRGYQEEVAQNLLRDKNGIVVLPTGTGKTYVAIRIILNHIEKRKRENNRRCKVVFLAPTATLVTQQLEKIQAFISVEDLSMCVKITGEDDIPVEMTKSLIKDEKHKILVVTPAIINKYFIGSEKASMLDFTLLIFDECHHAKKGDEYNLLLRRYHDAFNEFTLDQQSLLPQLMGMTASLGVGDATSERAAFDFMLSMCARFNLTTPPIAVEEHLGELEEAVNYPHESIVIFESHKDRFTDCLQREIMSTLEKYICEKVQKLSLTQEAAPLTQYKFPTDRQAQCYQTFIKEKEEEMGEYLVHDGIKSDVNHIKLAMRHLMVYHKCLKFVSLLQCKHGVEYLESKLLQPEYQSIDEIINLLKDNMGHLKQLQKETDEKYGNPKLNELHETLKKFFSEQPDSKVIIFVTQRAVTKYMAEWLCSLDPEHYHATEFVSSRPPISEGGKRESDLDEARKGFEGEKYNILVSTSVLEEGIDVQACNVVVRYMYSKDMIAKLQAKGRVREKEGYVVILADFRLHQQEQRNNFKEELMWKALEEIRDIKVEDFVSQVNDKKNSANLFPMKPASPKGPLRKTGIIRCSLCGSCLGKVEDVKCFLNNYHLVMDSSMSQKVRSEFAEPTMPPMDGWFFGMWNIKEIQVDRRKFKTYQKMKDVYEIDNLSVEKLQVLGERHQFFYNQPEKQNL